MLTRDFTRSRNLSQELAGSSSRAGCMAVVIDREKRALRYFHRCLKAVESGPGLSFFRLREILPVPNVCVAPVKLLSNLNRNCLPRARLVWISRPEPTTFSQRGIVAH